MLGSSIVPITPFAKRYLILSNTMSVKSNLQIANTELLDYKIK